MISSEWDLRAQHMTTRYILASSSFQVIFSKTFSQGESGGHTQTNTFQEPFQFSPSAELTELCIVHVICHLPLLFRSARWSCILWCHLSVSEHTPPLKYITSSFWESCYLTVSEEQSKLWCLLFWAKSPETKFRLSTFWKVLFSKPTP